MRGILQTSQSSLAVGLAVVVDDHDLHHRRSFRGDAVHVRAEQPADTVKISNHGLIHIGFVMPCRALNELMMPHAAAARALESKSRASQNVVGHFLLAQ
ncbi:MAG: hypothetical protein MZU91_03085 [Desulfosudis oleivorans]|nr:hypothetical protein [Desulfosudis oleivorans]